MKMIIVLTTLTWAVVIGAVPARGQDPDAGPGGLPGFLVIEGAADTTVFSEEGQDPESGRRALVWQEGTLSWPDSLDFENWGPFDKGVSFTAGLAGEGASGRLILRDGIFPITEPVVLTDGRLELSVQSGELEIQGARIIYRRTTSGPGDFRSGLLMLAGMTLLVVVLVRRARIKAADRSGR